MRIDLHTHSDRSDGTLSPRELVLAAREAELDVVALTDHDTAEGWAEAARAAAEVGLTLVPGMEISCRYGGAGVHLLAYLPDPTYPPLAEELERILEGRSDRVPRVLGKLRDLGIEIGLDDVRRVSEVAAASGRPHIADALIALGVVADRDEAFRRFLGPGGPAYVDRYAADLEPMIALVVEAGGAAVLAHPWARRHDHRALGPEGLARLARRGLAGVEVDHEDHDRATRDRLRTVAEELQLVVTGSSDFHGTGKKGHALGCNTTAREQLERLLDIAAAAAAAAGRRTPAVVR